VVALLVHLMGHRSASTATSQAKSLRSHVLDFNSSVKRNRMAPDDQAQRPDDQAQRPDGPAQRPDDPAQRPEDPAQRPDDQAQRPDGPAPQ
jgi:hypothetical protein